MGSGPECEFRSAIMSALGFAPNAIEPGRLHRFSTSTRRTDDAGWCLMFEDRRGGVFGCHRAGMSESWTAEVPRSMNAGERIALARQVEAATRQRHAAQRRQWVANGLRIAQLWAQSLPITLGDPCALYLQRRGIRGAWPLPDVLRFHPALPYWNGTRKAGAYPAMLAPLIAPDGQMVALHRTYLTGDGRKADVPRPKKLSGAAGPVAGACIPLCKPSRGCLGIAEGIETALAAWCASTVPTVAAYCAASLADWRWPNGVRRIVVFGDADKAGREAAEALRTRAMRAGLHVDVLVPSQDGADWCDVWASCDVSEVPA